MPPLAPTPIPPTAAPAATAGPASEPQGQSPQAQSPQGQSVQAHGIPSRIPLWVDLRAVPRHKRLGLLAAARAAGADAILLPAGDEHLGRPGPAGIACERDGTLRQGRKRIGRIVQVTDAASQRRAAKAQGLVVVEAPDWRVIPLENLIAARRDRPGTLFAHATGPEQALLFAQTLETGVHGIVLAPQGPAAITQASELLRQARAASRAQPTATPPALSLSPTAPSQAPLAATGRAGPEERPEPSRTSFGSNRLVLVPAVLTRVEDAGLGDRVCVDCTGLFADGEGLLVGSTARSFALVHAETVAADLVPTRPFRVNAGAVHSYLFGPDGRTSYLSEVAAGARVLAVSAQGSTRQLTVGRAKVEPRPHLLIAWEDGSAVLQNAETVRLVTPTGPRSVTDLRVGDTVLVHRESAARHTGLPVDGRLEER